MPRQDGFDAHFRGALHDRVKVVDLEPQQHAVAIRLVMAIANRTVMVVHLEAV